MIKNNRDTLMFFLYLKTKFGNFTKINFFVFKLLHNPY